MCRYCRNIVLVVIGPCILAMCGQAKAELDGLTCRNSDMRQRKKKHLHEIGSRFEWVRNTLVIQ
jgi:hypothetical protein